MLEDEDEVPMVENGVTHPMHTQEADNFFLRCSANTWCSIQPTFCTRTGTPHCGQKMIAVVERTHHNISQATEDQGKKITH